MTMTDVFQKIPDLDGLVQDFFRKSGLVQTDVSTSFVQIDHNGNTAQAPSSIIAGISGDNALNNDAAPQVGPQVTVPGVA